MFPARAGMSPYLPSQGTGTLCVPRASGDEPDAEPDTLTMPVCSPRERG